MSVAKLVNKKIPLTNSKPPARLDRVASIGKSTSRSNTDTTSAIEQAYSHEVSAIDLPEGDNLLKMGDYAVVLVEALKHVGTKERKRFATVVCSVVFGKKANQLAERVWDTKDYSCLAMVEPVPVETGVDAAGKKAFKVIDEAGQQFTNVGGSSMELVTPFSHLKSGQISL